MHHTPPLPVEAIIHLDNMFINTNKKEIIIIKKNPELLDQ
jgi:hypothetical protein